MKRLPIRVVLGKVGLDGHDRGALFVARVLMKAGMDVVYLGKFLPPEAVVRAVLEEDADVMALSFLSSEYNQYMPGIIGSLKEKARKDIVIVIGGLVFDKDIPKLKQMGVAGIFGPGTTSEQVVKFIKSAVSERTRKQGLGV